MKYLIIRTILFPYQVIRGAIGLTLIELYCVLHGGTYSVECPDFIDNIMRRFPMFERFYPIKIRSANEN